MRKKAELKLHRGRWYRRRDGKIVQVIYKAKGDCNGWLAPYVFNIYYWGNGRLALSEESPLDLVEEVAIRPVAAGRKSHGR